MRHRSCRRNASPRGIRESGIALRLARADPAPSRSSPAAWDDSRDVVPGQEAGPLAGRGASDAREVEAAADEDDVPAARARAAASALRGDGVDELRRALTGRVAVVTGHSGVGKSTVLNAVEPGLALSVGLVNQVSGRGRQTTTAAVWVPLAAGGAVVDTPGIREFGLFNVPKREISWLFRDLAAVGPRCKFGDCLRVGEPGCAVAAAVESGEIQAWRVDSYLRLLESLPDTKSWEIGRGAKGRVRPE